MATDVHPSVDEIKPYVSVGPTKDLSITVHKDTFDSAFLVFSIFFGLTLLIIVGITIFFANEQAKLPPPPPPPPLTQDSTLQSLQSNIGAAAFATAVLRHNNVLPEDGSAFTTQQACTDAPHTIWTEDKCECQPPFFGPTCSQERHDKRYFSVGIPNETTLQMTVLTDDMTAGKSFSTDTIHGSCSDQCNQTPDCIGFIYRRYSDSAGMCTLLGDNVVVPTGATIPYSPDTESTLYMRSSDNLHFEDRIFLGEFVRLLPPRFWIVNETPHYVQLVPGQIRALRFAPTYIKMYGNYIGIYCRHPFAPEDIDILLDRGPTTECYLHYPGTPLNLPIDWTYRVKESLAPSLYVAYV